MSKLYIVPTPIGNLDDITFRAVKILKEVDLILAEDTRTSKVLLQHFGIETPVSAYHQHNEHKITAEIISKIRAGKRIAVISDAGTPGISDAGFFLVRECIKEDIAVECLPGATAFVPALINSGFPTNRFCFEGFLPHKKGRQTRLKELENETRTMIFYESPHRLLKTLEEFISHFGKDRKASVARELTKMYEENVRGTLEEILSHFKIKLPKGEIVIILSGRN